MRSMYANSMGRLLRSSLVVMLLVLAAAPGFAAKNKKNDAPPPPPEKNWYEKLDLSRFVWPDPPNITRLRYKDYFCCERDTSQETTKEKKKATWMDRMAGGESKEEHAAYHPRFGLWSPWGVAVDSKGYIYVADTRVGAIFIFNPEDRYDVKMIKHGKDATFGMIMGLAMDDNDRLFVSDAKLSRVLVFDAAHKLEATIRGKMVEPVGLALDTENRFLYVVDTDQDVVLVYDADSYQYLRTIGVPGKKHVLTGPGQFAKPAGAAVDADGNLYVTDMLNHRVEEFDADGNFIREFGKYGDGPGYIASPKGIAVNSDGFLWVADASTDRIQMFTPEGRFLMWVGGHGGLPGQFNVLAGVAVDNKNNRVFTTEQYHARVQMFQYTTQNDAIAEYKKRTAAKDTKDAAKGKAGEQEQKPDAGKPKDTAETPKGSGAKQ